MRLPVAVEPVNDTACTSGCAHQRLAGVLAEAVHDVQHAGGNTGFEREIAEHRGGQRRQFAHLQHGGVAEREAGRDFPGCRHERHVPRRDQRAHADRMEQRVVQMRIGGIRMAVDAHAHLGEIVEVVGGARHELLARLRDRLAGVLRLGLRDLRHVLRDQLAELANELCAFRSGLAGPCGKRFFGRAHGGVDFFRTAAGDFGEHVLRRRIDGLEVVFRGARFAVDQMFDSHCLVLSLLALSIRRGRSPRRMQSY